MSTMHSNLGFSSTQPAPRRTAPPAASAVGAMGNSRALLSRVMSDLSATFVALLSFLPRGMMLVTMVGVPTNGLARTHPRPNDRIDASSWRLLSIRRPVRLSEQTGVPDRCAVIPIAARAYGGDFDGAGFGGKGFDGAGFDGAGFDDAMCAPVSGPVVSGFDGAVVVFRGKGAGTFGSSAAQRLGELTRAFDRERAMRRPMEETPIARAIRRLSPVRGTLVFDHHGRLSHPQDGESGIDAALLRQMSATARQLANGSEPSITRWLGRSGNGIVTPFRVVRHEPDAESRGSSPGMVWFARTPTPSEYAAIDPADLDGDPEMMRLMHAMRYLHENFETMPTLEDVSRQVHLSPFHFHRRFTDAMGVTPKHFLLDCQIECAQRELLAERQPLAKIARNCGFSHQSHFTSRFKQATGLTPLQWRRVAVQA